MAFRTVSEMVTKIRYHLGESTAGFWSAAEVLAAINTAKNDLQKHILKINEDWFVVEGSTITTVSGTDAYDLDANFVRLKSLECTTSGRQNIGFIPKDQSAQAWKDLHRSDITVSSPQSFMYDIFTDKGTQGASPVQPKSRIIFSPYPREALTLVYDYHTWLEDVSDDAEFFGILDPFSDYIEFRATGILLLKGPSGPYKTWFGLAQDAIPSMEDIAKPRHAQGPEYVEGFDGD